MSNKLIPLSLGKSTVIFLFSFLLVITCSEPQKTWEKIMPPKAEKIKVIGKAEAAPADESEEAPAEEAPAEESVEEESTEEKAPAEESVE